MTPPHPSRGMYSSTAATQKIQASHGGGDHGGKICLFLNYNQCGGRPFPRLFHHQVPTDGWMDEAAESSHDFVICPSDTKHQRRRIRPAEGEDLDIWVSLMKDGGARCAALSGCSCPDGCPEGPISADYYSRREQKAPWTLSGSRRLR